MDDVCADAPSIQNTIKGKYAQQKSTGDATESIVGRWNDKETKNSANKDARAIIYHYNYRVGISSARIAFDRSIEVEMPSHRRNKMLRIRNAPQTAQQMM